MPERGESERRKFLLLTKEFAIVLTFLAKQIEKQGKKWKKQGFFCWYDVCYSDR
jgi:hypothetical protein